MTESLELTANSNTMNGLEPRTHTHRSEPPKRCRSAYNIFYQAERLRILAGIPDKKDGGHPTSTQSRKAHGKIGFQELAKTISVAWKALDTEGRAEYVALARRDKERYLREKAEWHNYVAQLERVYAAESWDPKGRETTPSEKNVGRVTPSSSASTPTLSPVDRKTTHSPSMPKLPGMVSRCDEKRPPGVHSLPMPVPRRATNTHREDLHFSAAEMRSLAEVSRQLGPDGCAFIIRKFA